MAGKMPALLEACKLALWNRLLVGLPISEKLAGLCVLRGRSLRTLRFKIFLSYKPNPVPEAHPRIGNARTRFFVAAYIALQIAGASGGIGGSPAPVGGSVLSTK